MQELLKQLSEKAGVAKDQAEKACKFLMENATQVPKWLTGESSEGVQLLTDKAGLARDQAEKVFAFLRSHSGEVTGWLGTQSKGLLEKAKGAIGGMFGNK